MGEHDLELSASDSKLKSAVDEIKPRTGIDKEVEEQVEIVTHTASVVLVKLTANGVASDGKGLDLLERLNVQPSGENSHQLVDDWKLRPVDVVVAHIDGNLPVVAGEVLDSSFSILNLTNVCRKEDCLE